MSLPVNNTISTFEHVSSVVYGINCKILTFGHPGVRQSRAAARGRRLSYQMDICFNRTACFVRSFVLTQSLASNVFCYGKTDDGGCILTLDDLRFISHEKVLRRGPMHGTHARMNNAQIVKLLMLSSELKLDARLGSRILTRFAQRCCGILCSACVEVLFVWCLQYVRTSP